MDSIIKNNKIAIYKTKPLDFNALVEVAACYIEIEGKILLLQQAEKKIETGCWGVPAGKLEKHETPDQAACRELFEETGIYIEEPSHMLPLGCLYISKPEMDYVYHLFQVTLMTIPEVTISHEHQNYVWAEINNLHTLPLMTGAKEAIEQYQKRAAKNI